jgi:hypothetical protein
MAKARIAFAPGSNGVQVVFTSDEGELTCDFTPALWASFKATIEKLMPPPKETSDDPPKN